MKAFLNRINRGLSKGGERDKEAALREKIPPLPPLPDWPPQRAPSTPSTLDSSKPLPELSVRPLPPIEEPESSSSTDSSATPTPVATLNPLPPASSTEGEYNLPSRIESTDSSRSRPEPDSAGRSSRKTNGSMSNGTNSDVQKKVAFLSPPPTPGPTSERALPDVETSTPPGSAPLKTTVSRFQAAHSKDTRGSTSTATSSKTDIASTNRSAKQTSTRAATSPFPAKGYGDGASIHQSLRSGTPYSQTTNASSRILAAQSWSEVAEEDLVSNIGQRERTRQEVLWEIVASEERYVNELVKLKETFIEPLLHPYSAPSPMTSPTPIDYDDYHRSETPRESLDHLPIAARFLSPTGFRSDSPTGQASPVPSRKDEGHPTIDGESMNSAEEEEADDRMGAAYHSRQKTVAGMSQAAKHSHPRSPYNARSGGGKYGTSVPFPSRSHQSLPPPPRMNQMSSSTHSLGRQSFMAERDRDYSGDSHAPSAKATTTSGTSVLRKFRRSNTARDAPMIGAVPPSDLPEDLRKCLEVIEGGILEGHIKLSEGLRKRYEEQYPLVRSLADVFVSNSHILAGYATYVLHLERALEQVDNALSNASANKKPKKQDADQWQRICQSLQRLEVIASEKGETGLAISLSKPFQRLLKYPLLFQNLLFHTDPSTFEYESTLQMVAEVETIVRSIEDEKIQKEERDKTRDVFARIEGLDKVKQLMVPKPSRILMEERPVMGVNPLSEANGQSSSSPPSAGQGSKGVKGKTSFKRLSDVLQPNNGIGGKKDQWLVVFNDVVLRCQRTGTTSLPLVSVTNSRTNSLPELQGKAKYATTGRRSAQTKPRNMYKFIKIETWAIGDVVQPRTGVISMEDVVRSRQTHSSMQPRIVPLPDDDEGGGAESDDSDRKSKMSFSYWGADKVTLQKPTAAKRQLANTARRGAGGSPTSYGRESSANAKFGTRLLSADSANAPRPGSRRTQATPASRRQQPHSEEGHSVKATVTRSDRPGWNGSTRATATPIPKRPRNTSQTSAAASAKQLASPAPSEDSGVGFYRQIIAQNPSINALNASA